MSYFIYWFILLIFLFKNSTRCFSSSLHIFSWRIWKSKANYGAIYRETQNRAFTCRYFSFRIISYILKFYLNHSRSFGLFSRKCEYYSAISFFNISRYWLLSHLSRKIHKHFPYWRDNLVALK